MSWVLITHTADIAYSKLEIECSKSRLVPGLEFDQFPPQICCFDLSISTCDRLQYGIMDEDVLVLGGKQHQVWPPYFPKCGVCLQSTESFGGHNFINL